MAAQSSTETIRIGIPGKLVDFSPFFVGLKTGIYRSEGLEPQFIVMRSGIIFPALLSAELDYTTLYQSAMRSAISGLPVRVIATLITKQSFFLFSQREIRRVQDQGLNNLVWLGDLLGDVPSNGLSTTVRKIKENPDQVYHMLRASVRSMIYTREHKQEALPILMKEFPGLDRSTLAGTLDFYLKAMSPDGRVSDSVVREMIYEQRVLLNVKNEVPITQVADFGPLQRVVKELNPNQ